MKRNLIAIVAVLILVFGVVYFNEQRQTASNSKKESPMEISSTLTPTLSTGTIHSNWNRFISKEMGISFEYPRDLSVTEDTNGSNQSTANFKSNDGKTRFSLSRTVSQAESSPPYKGTVVDKNINGVSWKEFTPDKGNRFCDAGSCGGIAPSYYANRNGYYYSVAYYSREHKDTINQILSTFAFTN